MRVRLVVLAAALSACASPAADNVGIARDYAQHVSHVEVTAAGNVSRVLPDERGPSGVHQRSIVALSGSSQTVLVDNNVTIGKRVPWAVGATVVVHGEYVWNNEGGLIHFTHHDPEHTHEGGWIELSGARYD
jgi:uncharacterized protein DUF3465